MASITSPLAYQSDSRRAASRFDWPLLFSAVALLTFGLMSLFSVGQGASHESDFKKQILMVVVGALPFTLFYGVSPGFWRRTSTWLYLLNLVVLSFVLLHGHAAKGADRWIPLPGGVRFQPSELAKILTILTLSAYYANRQDLIHKVSTFIVGFLHVLVPCFLIWKQPHLGATLSILVMWFAVSVIAGVPLKTLSAFLAILAILGGAATVFPGFKSIFLHSYQESRFKGLTKKTKKDLRNSSYQTDRAEIAFGVGGPTGVGFGHGEQKAAGFIPEQRNDFIVTVVGEEGGLIGCTLLLIAYGIFFYRIFLVMLNATEPFYKMIAAGIFAVLGFHTFINIGMVLGLLPVVGLWLPFMSSGGTAIWLCMSCVALLLAIRRKQRPLLF